MENVFQRAKAAPATTKPPPVPENPSEANDNASPDAAVIRSMGSVEQMQGVLHGGVEALLVSAEREDLTTLTYRLRPEQGQWLRDVAYDHSRKVGGKADASKVLRLILDEAMKASKKVKRK